DFLYPPGPASELVPKCAVGDIFGQIQVPNAREHQTKFLALKTLQPKSACYEVIEILQAEFLVLGGAREVEEPLPADDSLRGEIAVLLRYRCLQGGAGGLDDTDAAQVVCKRLPAAVALALVADAVEQLQKPCSERLAKFCGQIAQVKLEEELQ